MRSDEPQSEAWLEIAPLLEPALAQLGSKDHDAIVLRFFEAGSSFGSSPPLMTLGRNE
jgi:hypothetical protein